MRGWWKFNNKYVLVSELNKLDLTDQKYRALLNMIKSENTDDVNLAKELIDQFRTKRLKSKVNDK